MIGSIGSFLSRVSGASAPSKASEAKSEKAEKSENKGSASKKGDTPTLSNLARQLSASMTRAELRDKTLSRKELAEKADRLMSQIAGDGYHAKKSQHDSEVPKTDDPELLARAKQATAYINDSERGGRSVKNPFAGLSRAELSSIIYDESGTFTVNERRAAWAESNAQEEAWRHRVIAKSNIELQQTGKLVNFFQDVLDHYNTLPPIEQAQYPENYAADLQYKIKLGFNYHKHRAEGNDSPKTLIELVLEAGDKYKEIYQPKKSDKS